VPTAPRLLVVADDAVARAGLRTLAEAAGFTVTAETTVDAIDPVDEEAADAVLWDVGAAGAASIPSETARRLPIVALLWSDDQARDVLAGGARAVLVRDRLDEQLAPAVHAATAGLLAIAPALADALGPAARPSVVPELVETLTARESEVLQLMAAGLTNRRIGERLGISEHTVKFHVNAVLGKLAARTRGEAIAQAARLGLLLL
jgi:DNA-binding NarL/FixJ family response regulator